MRHPAPPARIVAVLAALVLAAPAHGASAHPEPVAGRAESKPRANGTPRCAGARVTVAGVPACARASSTLKSAQGRYAVSNLFDGKVETAWVEGAKGDGRQEWVAIEFDRPIALDGFLLAPGYGRSAETFEQNLAPAVVTVEADGEALAEYELRYAMRYDDCTLEREAWNRAARVIVLKTPRTVKALKLTIQVALRTKTVAYEDLALSEWTPLLAGAPPPAGVDPHTALVIRALRALRDGALPDADLSPELQVRDVFADYPGEWAAAMREDVRTTLHSYGARPDVDARRNFERVARGALVGAPVTLFGGPGVQRVIGKALFEPVREDLEWTLSYEPFLELERGYADVPPLITALDAWLHPYRCSPYRLPDEGEER